MTTSVYGIRHHGPGSARSLREALHAQRPDILLIEGPPEADQLLPLVADPQMSPPVALLAFTDRQSVPGEPGTSAFWPFAVFSPEWQAVRYALEADIPVRFCDLPAAHQLAMDRGKQRRARDPIGELAAVAGYDDPERWWEDAVEHVPAPAAFAAIAEAMTALRDADAWVVDDSSTALEGGRCHIDRPREAYMRRTLRKALKEGYTNVAVVCGAWHVPALTELGPAAPDDRLLRGLPKCKPLLTWVPWTYGRLAFASGYGAGVSSPGWYHHLFDNPRQPVERWLAKAAAVLRDNGISASPAHVVESVRLANTLAGLRDRPLPGLAEVTEAARAVLCEGSEPLLAIIQAELIIGERLGQIPADTPMVALQKDLRDSQRTLKLKPDPVPKDHEFDLRRPIDLGRSRLLHRLTLLGVPWGATVPGSNSTGTFREAWRLAWRPELDLALIEASTWGVTVEAAAVARVRDVCEGSSGTLADLASVTERCLLAQLPDALTAALTAVRERAALDADVTHLMEALPALARAARYGDVRGTDPAALATAADDLLTRVCAGLPAALVSLDTDAERAIASRIEAVHGAVALLATGRARWLDALSRLEGRCPPLVAGRVTRLLLDAGRLTQERVAPLMSRALSPGVPPAEAAGWTEGFLAGSGLLLVHDTRLLTLVDGWLDGLNAEAFTGVLPALRRTFGEFNQPERRAIGEQAARLGSGVPRQAARSLDADRGDRAVAAVNLILAAGRLA